MVSISGACSRAGKTALAEAVLRAVPHGRASALKFTTTDDVFSRCPRGTTCTVCDIDVPYRLVQDRRVLDEEGTDTARLRAAGARTVVWAIARAAAAESAWEAAKSALPPGLTVVEGSTVATLHPPRLGLFVAHPFLSPARWKPTSPGLIATADLVVVNVPRGEDRAPSPEVTAALTAARGQRSPHRVADVTRPLAEWAPEAAEALQALLRESAPVAVTAS